MNRLITLAACTLLVTGCGAASDSNPTPPPTAPPTVPPVPTIGPPAVVTIHAGDAQSTEPGRPVQTRLAVMVKDASGQPVSNVPVSFAVDSGDGVLAGGQTTTDASGIATAGIWTLGPSEGRNTVLVTAASLASIRFGATGRHTSVSVSAGSIGASGGTLLVNQSGSVLNGFEIKVPASAFSQSVAFSITTASSAGLVLSAPAAANGISSFTAGVSAVAHVARNSGVLAPVFRAVTPVITVVSNGPATAAGDVLLRVPLAQGAGLDLIVAVVDSLNHPLAYLPVVAVDAVSATVSTRGLDRAIYAQIIPSSAPQTRRLSIVVFTAGAALTLKQLYPSPYTSIFTMGVHNWEFPEPWTAMNRTSDAGMILAEWAAVQRIPGGIFNRYRHAAGVVGSNTRGFMSAGGLSRDFYYENARVFGNPQIAYDARVDPVRYTRSAIHAILWSLVYGLPTPIQLTDGVNERLVLAIGWNPTDESITIRDAAYPNRTAKLMVPDSRFQPYVDPWTPSITYTVLHHAVSTAYALWPAIKADLDAIVVPNGPEPRAASWTQNSIAARDTWIPGDARSVPDSVYMVGDTTRVFPIANVTTFPAATNIALASGWTVQMAYPFSRNRTTGAWTSSAPYATNSEYVDARPNQWLERTIGFEIRKVESADFSQSSWLGWRRIDIVKYAMAVANVTANAGVPVTFAITSPGGPTLPRSATYEWNFGDGTPLMHFNASGPVPIAHTFTAAGTRTVVLSVYHPTTARLIARAQATAEIKDVSKWRVASFQQTALANNFPASLQPAAPTWEKALTMNEIRDSILARVGGAIIEMIPQGGARPQGFTRANDFSVRASPSQNDTVMYLTFPRGSGVLAEVVAARGLALSPALGFPAFYPHKPFTNAFTRTAGTTVSFTGMAANWVIPITTQYTCQSPGGTSPTRGHIEFAATTTATGLSGTITFVTQAAWAEVQAVPPGCVWDAVGAIRRTFSFTATPM